MGAVEYWHYEVMNDEDGQHFNARIITRVGHGDGLHKPATGFDADSYGHAFADSDADIYAHPGTFIAGHVTGVHAGADDQRPHLLECDSHAYTE